MKNKEIVKLLVPGVIVGLFLGFLLTMLVGVNKEDAIPNYFGGAMCCIVPTFLNCLVVLKMGSKQIKRKISFIEIFKRVLPYLILAGVIGLVFVILLIENVLKIDTRTLSVMVTAVYQSILGVVVSTICAYLAFKKYLSDVKYTKRK